MHSCQRFSITYIVSGGNYVHSFHIVVINSAFTWPAKQDYAPKNFPAKRAPGNYSSIQNKNKSTCIVHSEMHYFEAHTIGYNSRNFIFKLFLI